MSHHYLQQIQYMKWILAQSKFNYYNSEIIQLKLKDECNSKQQESMNIEIVMAKNNSNYNEYPFMQQLDKKFIYLRIQFIILVFALQQFLKILQFVQILKSEQICNQNINFIEINMIQKPQDQNQNKSHKSSPQSVKKSKAGSIKKQNSIQKSNKIIHDNQGNQQNAKSAFNKTKPQQHVHKDKQISQRQWEAVYTEENFNIGMVKQNTSKPKVKSEHKKEQVSQINQIYWETAYIDQKYYLSDPASLERLRALQQQIQTEKLKLAHIQNTQQFEKSFLSQQPFEDSAENHKMQCLTQINESRFIERKKNAQNDLLNEELKYRNKIQQMKRKKSIMKKQIGCGTNEKNIQVNSKQINKQQEQFKNQQKKQKDQKIQASKSPSIKKEKLVVNQAAKQISVKQQSVKKPQSVKNDKSVKKQETEKKSQNVNQMNKSEKKSEVSKQSLKKQNDQIGLEPVAIKSQKQAINLQPSQEKKQSSREKSERSSQSKNQKVILNLPDPSNHEKSLKSPSIKTAKLDNDKSQKKSPSIKNQQSIDKSVKKSQTGGQMMELLVQKIFNQPENAPKSEKKDSISGQPVQKNKSEIYEKQSQKKDISQKSQHQQISSPIKQPSVKSKAKSKKQQIMEHIDKSKLTDNKSFKAEQQQKQPSKKSSKLSQSPSVKQQQKVEENKSQSSKVQQSSSKKETHNNLQVPQIKINTNSFKKADKSVQWQEIQPSVSKFSIAQKTQQKNNEIFSERNDNYEGKSQKSKISQKISENKSNNNQLKSVNEKSQQKEKSISQRSQKQQQEQSIKASSRNNKKQLTNELNQQKSERKSKYKSEKESQPINSQRSQHQNYQQSQQNQQNLLQSSNQNTQRQQQFEKSQASKRIVEGSRSQIFQKKSQRRSEVSQNNVSQSQIISQKKASFKIHSRQNSVKSKNSRSKHNQKEPSRQKERKLIQFPQKSQKNYSNHPQSSRDYPPSSQRDTQALKNQLQIKKLHQQISQLQQKLKKVEQKQQQMIHFENNPTKIMSELQASHAGSGSQCASPLGKFNPTNRLRVQQKLSLQNQTVQFNTYEQKLKQTAQQNQKLEKLKLQQQIGRLKKVIRQMQMEKIKSIQYEAYETSSKVELRKPSILDPNQNNNSRISQKYNKESLNSDMLETKRNQWNSQSLVNKDKDDAGKIKKNSPIKYHIDSPKKYNRLNAERHKPYSQMAQDEGIDVQQPPLPLRKKLLSNQGGAAIGGSAVGRSRDLTKSQLIHKFQQNQRNFHQFLQSSRLLVQQPQSLIQPNNQSMPEALQHKNQLKLNPSTISKAPPQYNKTINRNFSQIIQKMKNQNPQDQIAVPEQIVVGNISLPDLPQTPNLNMSQDDLLELAKKTYILFGINVDEDQNQLCMKKYKNCVVFTFGNNQQQTILWHYSGKFYFGGWKSNNDPGQGQKIGEGLQYIPGKHLYKGQFLAGKKNGNGIVKMSNGNIYEGQWIQGTKNGRGVYFEASTGTYYSGQWKDGKRDGYGILKFSNNQFYQGTFSKSIKHGYGVQKFANGDYYKGQYQKGKFHGKGKYTWSNGSSYEGDFVEGYRNGQGNWKSSRKNGDIYIGGYQNDKKYGYGRYVWVNGCVYEGYFKNDLKNGKGRLVYQDGKQIKGVWQDGNLISTDQQSRKIQQHEQQPLRRSIRASSLKNSPGYGTSTAYRKNPSNF